MMFTCPILCHRVAQLWGTTHLDVAHSGPGPLGNVCVRHNGGQWARGKNGPLAFHVWPCHFLRRFLSFLSLRILACEGPTLLCSQAELVGKAWSMVPAPSRSTAEH